MKPKAEIIEWKNFIIHILKIMSSLKVKYASLLIYQ